MKQINTIDNLKEPREITLFKCMTYLEQVLYLFNNKQNKLISGETIKTINNQNILGSGNINIEGGGSSDYEELDNLPSINGVELIGNLTNEELNIPTKTSDLINDSDFINSYYHDNTKQDNLTAGTNISIVDNVISATGGIASWGNITGNIDSQTDLKNKLNSKQDTLISSTNIKTINNNSILGSGNLTVVGEQGPQGEKGETGPQGPQGPQGETGQQGPKGDTLVSMTIGTTTTGAAGTNASVTNVGTATEPVLNFTIPRGNTGAQGPQGIQGLRGETGQQGPKGDTVVSVQVGTTTTGDSGTNASVTNSGTDTEAVLNFVIPKGEPGKDGAIQYTAGTGIEITSNNVINNTQTSAEWGNITGDIEDQSDLQSALSNKQNVITNLVDGVNHGYHIWNGTEAQYNALTTKESSTIYLIHE